MKKGFVDLPTIISFVMSIVIYTTFLYPTLKNFLSPAGADSLTIAILALVPACILIAILISLFKYAFGTQGNTVTRA